MRLASPAARRMASRSVAGNRSMTSTVATALTAASANCRTEDSRAMSCCIRKLADYTECLPKARISMIRGERRSLRPDAALDDRLGHTADGDNVRRSTVVTAVLLGSVVDLVKRLHHHLLQPAVHLGLVPEELLQVLRPFEIGDGHTASTSKNVGQHHHLLTTEHKVGFRCGRSIGGFGYDPGP